MTQDDIIRIAREACPYTTDEMRGAFYEGFLKGAVAEREACAKLCQDKAMRLETKAQEAIEAGEHGEVNAIRSTAWQISDCAAAIRARG